MQQTTLIAFLVFGASQALPPSSTKEYRDYEYNRKTDAFYKLHIESNWGLDSADICKSEGANLMVPSSKEDIEQLHKMFKQFPDLGDYVYVGNDGNTHESAEETPIIDLEPTSEEEEALRASSNVECEVVNREGDIETTPCSNRHPFICKVEAKDAPYDEQCDVYANDYKYYDSTKSCYRVPPRAVSWNEAYSYCRAENAHLVVLNSANESQVVKEFLKTAPRFLTAYSIYFYFAGIRADMPDDKTKREFRTIFNDTLDQAGFNTWSDGEPNNRDDSEYCGAILASNGKYNDVNCINNYGFICEKEVMSTLQCILENLQNC